MRTRALFVFIVLSACAAPTPQTGGAVLRFAVPAFSRYSMLNDTDEMSFLLGAAPDIAAYERTHPASIDTTRLRTHG